MTRAGLRAAALRILRAGLKAVEPGQLVRAHLSARGRVVRVGSVRVGGEGRLFIVAVGKAAVPMAQAAHAVLGQRITAAILIAPKEPPPLPRTAGFVAGHPIPNASGLRAGRAVIRLLESAGKGDVIVLLLSGGASALMPAPVRGVSLQDKQRLTRFLLRRGASIREMNAVRQRLSLLKGGGFARIAAPARVITLALSDVPGDDLRVIGSGPALPDPASRMLARRAVRRLLGGVAIPAGVRRALDRRTAFKALEPLGHHVVIGSGSTFAAGAEKEARGLGFRVRPLIGFLQGEARLCGPALVERFLARRFRRPVCFIATGETVVNVRGGGRGGRNQEVAVSAVPALARGKRPAVLLAFATDGVDGNSSASGGCVDNRTAARAVARGVSIQRSLDRNDSTTALGRLESLLATGPTETNVADVAVLVG